MSALELRGRRAGTAGNTGGGRAEATGTNALTSLRFLSLKVFPLAGGQTESLF